MFSCISVYCHTIYSTEYACFLTLQNKLNLFRQQAYQLGFLRYFLDSDPEGFGIRDIYPRRHGIISVINLHGDLCPRIVGWEIDLKINIQSWQKDISLFIYVTYCITDSKSPDHILAPKIMDRKPYWNNTCISAIIQITYFVMTYCF